MLVLLLKALNRNKNEANRSATKQWHSTALWVMPMSSYRQQYKMCWHQFKVHSTCSTYTFAQTFAVCFAKFWSDCSIVPRLYTCGSDWVLRGNLPECQRTVKGTGGYTRREVKLKGQFGSKKTAISTESEKEKRSIFFPQPFAPKEHRAHRTPCPATTKR